MYPSRRPFVSCFSGIACDSVRPSYCYMASRNSRGVDLKSAAPAPAAAAGACARASVDVTQR